MIRPYNTDKKRREAPDGELKTPIFRKKPMGVYIEGGSAMLIVETVVLAAAMVMYVGAEWIAEDVLDKNK